ncbi:type I polyketide synthase [Streptomyces arboris]|uniref:SDR family NAD(P)-dependent oxidoreductase n=1 Tax=Streptomyces arboris TaxID=2600619 RepID=A0A5N5EJD0_9ACTN|nr:type I polyketide synthase [Streptomyces arboris]KAB2590373.1 SDR family NAD(P)-dependent oxidoreductase [Streptomyces arboris]
MTRVSIVGMACRFPDAASPRELWENAVAGRRAFRRIPDVRMRLDDYWDPDPAAPDRFYARMAAVLEGYAFDRVAHRVTGSTYRSTDLTHWLALETAGRALADAGFPEGGGLPRARTGVVVGNTLTGEFTRASGMRLRWPYVRRVLAEALRGQGWDDDRLAVFLDGVEKTYKQPFPAIDEDSLAGALSNTIAGRICNHFGLGGGGYTVDGACSSSLLSVTSAAGSLLSGDLDVAVAGGVDLSIDPFEIVGFAKTGALARSEMRVYDRGSNGFWPGEGCGMVVLMREEDARAAGLRQYATIAGWGVSSDGQGSITRPESSGYRLALARAYERAGFGIETVPLFEGHGTGTPVGDANELGALTAARAEAAPGAPAAAISSAKAMIGHTKAAAGVAGLIKAVMAVDARLLPPAIGCREPHELLTGPGAGLRALRTAEPWPQDMPLRAGVTAMGFGGINTHVVIDKETPPRHRAPHRRHLTLAGSLQDCELLLLDGESPAELRERLTKAADLAPKLSYAQLADLAHTLQRDLRELPWRAAAVVTSPDDAERRLRQLADALEQDPAGLVAVDDRAFIGCVRAEAGSIGFLFPGQGSGRGTDGGALRRRFAQAAEVYERAGLPATGDPVATEVAQPRIVAAATAGLRVLDWLGVEAEAAVGHSLGELVALHWAGALDEARLLEAARVRGEAMARHGEPGTMASLAAAPERVKTLMYGVDAVIAGYNGPERTVVAGTADAVAAVTGRATAHGVGCTPLAVSHAFHSPLVAPAADVFGTWLDDVRFGPVRGRVLSTVTGQELAVDTDLRELLHRQITEPVLFTRAVQEAAADVDLFVEVGPGQVLSSLATGATGVPSVALDTDETSLRGLLRVAGAAYVIGAPLMHERLFGDRLTRPLDLDAEFHFLASPCESVAPDGLPAVPPAGERHVDGAGPTVDAEPYATGAGPQADNAGEPVGDEEQSAVEVLRTLVAERAELPVDLVRDDSSLLDDLHMSSITVGQIVNQAATRLGLATAHAPANFATATLAELGEALESLAGFGPDGGAGAVPAVLGAAPWVRAFVVDLDEELPAAVRAEESEGDWELFAAPAHPYAEELRSALRNARVGPGVLVCLPPRCPPDRLTPALEGARRALAGGAGQRFVLVQEGLGAAGLAKSLHLEAPHVRTTVVDTPAAEGVVDRIVAEVSATTRFTEVSYDIDGTRRVPVLRVLPVRGERTDELLDSTDVLLVTGGGKGITAECALAVAGRSGAALAIVGRSDPAGDEVLSANLRRMADRGLRVGYARADVTDPERVRAAVAELTAALGPVTAVLHGAGQNEPAALADLTEEDFERTLAPKVDGLRSVLAAVDRSALKLLVCFGSVIGRTGLRGEAHYATANERLADLALRFAADSPHCRVRCLEWSVWSGVGMGEKLSVVESLAREGITPISPDQGVEVLLRLIADPDAPPVTVVTGRTGEMDTLRRERPPLPLHRFTVAPLVHYHGAELVTEAELNVGTDPYLADHLLDGNLLLPAVIGMEAMCQVAAAVTGRDSVPVLEDLRFLRPVVVPPDGSARVRIAATVTAADTVEVVLHAEESGFVAEHFRARLVFSGLPVPEGPPVPDGPGLGDVPLDPVADLYGDLLFQGDRFRRLRRFHRVSARHVDAELSVDEVADWFAAYLPGGLLLADPGMRDALMHGNQVCVPDATLLPSGIDRLYPLAAGADVPKELRYVAVEREHDGRTYVYDIAARAPDGRVVERWEGLRLTAVRRGSRSGPWSGPLLASHMERTVEELTGRRVALAVEPPDEHPPAEGPAGAAARRSLTARAAGRALGAPAAVTYRPDGRPELVAEGLVMSASHTAGWTLCAVADAAAVGCDIEPVVARPTAAWEGLLGDHAPLAASIARETGDGFDTAATVVWTAVECMQKAGFTTHAPLSLTPRTVDDWTVFASGGVRVAVLVTRLKGLPDPVAAAVLVTAEPRP